MTVDFGRIRTFLQVVDANGFQAAARREHRSQPWLSVQIRQLEKAIGFPLIVRSPSRGVDLTAEGRQFLVYARKLGQAYDELLQGAHEIARTRGGELRIGADPFTLHTPERNLLLARYIDANPEVHVEITSAAPVELYGLLETGELDLIVATEPDRTKFQSFPLFTYQISLLVPVESPLAVHEAIDLELLRGDYVLTVAKDYSPKFMAQLARHFDKFGVALKSAREPGYGAVLRYAQLTRKPLVTVDFSPLFHEVPADMTFRYIKGKQLEVTWHAVRQRMPQTPAVRRFLSLARQLGKTKAPRVSVIRPTTERAENGAP
ncbi:LysR family transcriptional regulator [Sphingobium sp. V4]|uniref:LysR family transcriptional regulator n=1 Tax=Sphingobium sp. V4 TaxID=3038927 RepID=UPI002558357F|nr:LysR family transcriptional regulator [Sphingobium sp. V4]WIW89424.1 LysR family transcriptional regulator [Sphingobium sp. V4]